MKLEVFNQYLTEEKSMAEFVVMLEAQFDGNDLSEIASDSLIPGVKILQDIARGNSDEFTSDDIKLAKKTWAFMRRLLVDSKPGLKEELKVNAMVKKHRGR